MWQVSLLNGANQAPKTLLLEIIQPAEVGVLSRVRLFATLWTVAHQAPLSMGFFRQEY